MREQFQIQKSKSKIFIVNSFLLFTFCFLIITASAQSVSASVDRDKILLGEQVTLRFTLSNLNEHGAYVSSWPQITDSINHLEILKKTPIDSIPVSDTYTYQQSFTVTSFDSGRWQIGPYIFTIKDKITNKEFNLTTTALYVTVLPVDVSSLKDYHAMKDIIDVQTSFNWTPVIIAVIILVVAIAVFIIIKNKKKKPAVVIKEVLKGTPLERAIEKLQLLGRTTLSSTETIKKFHSDIDEITRKYFEEITQVKALQLTATELFSRMHVYLQDAKLREKFRQIFETNAAVKFAKYMPQPEESKATLNEVIQSLQQIDDLVNSARYNANRMV